MRWLSRLFNRPSLDRIVADTSMPLGKRGEALAVELLRQKGYKILATSVTTKEGEIDIVARDGKTCVFVEVKTRRSGDMFDAMDSVDLRKQKQLTNLALAYLKRRGWLQRPSRFDILGICWPDDSVPPETKHIENAFEAVGDGQMFC